MELVKAENQLLHYYLKLKEVEILETLSILQMKKKSV